MDRQQVRYGHTGIRTVDIFRFTLIMQRAFLRRRYDTLSQINVDNCGGLLAVHPSLPCVVSVPEPLRPSGVDILGVM